MTDRKAKARAGRAFVVSDPSHKDKGVASVGHPDLWLRQKVPRFGWVTRPFGRDWQGDETMTLDDLGSQHISAILALNNEHALETSLLDAAALEDLLGIAFYARGIEQGKKAFLLALDQNAAYANPNFRWFKARYESFVYVDRVIVSAEERGRGLASMLYRDLFLKSIAANQLRVVCEVNTDPPNPASQTFHAALGFQVIGEASIYGGQKTVSYLEKHLK
jgi:predicted GNAT superfamily acetyltransferase